MSFRIRRLAAPLSTTLLTFLILIALLFWAESRFGSVRCAIIYLQGERFMVVHPLIAIPQANPGTSYDVPFLLRNDSTAPIQIVGCSSTCGCVAVRNLPFTMEPASTSEFWVRVKPADRFPKRVGLRVFTDSPNLPVLGLTVEVN